MNTLNSTPNQSSTSIPEASEQNHERVWQMDVSHVYANKKSVTDTHVVLWRPENPSDDHAAWTVEKRIDEVGGYSLAALAIRDEKNALSKLMQMDLPCAPLAPWRGKPGGGDFCAIYTRYGGASIEELSRHAMKPEEYAAVNACALGVADQYAKEGVVALDFEPRNVTIELSNINHGVLEFTKCVGIDHRFTCFRGAGRASAWPFLGLNGCAPEVVALRKQDQRVNIQSYLPDFPAKSHKVLQAMLERKKISPGEYVYWMGKMRSHFFGAALDDGELNIDAVMQSIFAAGWQKLQAKNIVEHRRLHPKALAFLAAKQSILRKMNHPQPEQRFDSLQDAANAWMEGAKVPLQSTTVLQLKAPVAKEVHEGASQPDTMPDTGHPAPINGLWERWSTPQELTAKGAIWWNQLPLTPAIRRGLGVVVTGLLFIMFIFGSPLQKPTPAILNESAELEQVAILARTLNYAKATETVLPQVELLTKIQRETKSPRVRQHADEVLKTRWMVLMKRLAIRLNGTSIYSTEQQKPVISEVYAWAKIDPILGKDWLGDGNERVE